MRTDETGGTRYDDFQFLSAASTYSIGCRGGETRYQYCLRTAAIGPNLGFAAKTVPAAHAQLGDLLSLLRVSMA
jgi:hypothetical protein